MRKKILRQLFGVLLCAFFSITAHAMTAMIYQPQQRDMKLPDVFWSATFSDLRKRGFDTLVIQWTQFGEIFSKDKEKQWLKQRLQDAVTADLKLVIGLYADPDVFSSLDTPTDLLEPYFLKNTEKNLALAREFSTLLPKDSIAGWYLTMEVDDRRWRDQTDQAVLAKQLARDVRELKTLSHLPVYISTFFKGNSEPKEFKEMLSELKRKSDLRIWVQDGVGTGKLLPAETALYMSALGQCQETPAAGVIYEIFRQVGPDNNFKAEPLSAAQLKKALLQRAPCGGDSIFFSLRYLYLFGY